MFSAACFVCTAISIRSHFTVAEYWDLPSWISIPIFVDQYFVPRWYTRWPTDWPCHYVPPRKQGVVRSDLMPVVASGLTKKLGQGHDSVLTSSMEVSVRFHWGSKVYARNFPWSWQKPCLATTQLTFVRLKVAQFICIWSPPLPSSSKVPSACSLSFETALSSGETIHHDLRTLWGKVLFSLLLEICIL